MRKAEKNGYVRGVPKSLDDGIEIARWSTKGGAHWCSLREQVNPVVGTYWSYEGSGFAGGYTQAEGFDRQRVIGALAEHMERAAVVDGNRMQLEFNLAQVDVEQAVASMSSPAEAFRISAQWLGVPNTFFAARVEEVARAEGVSADRIDAMKTAGLKANILYLLRQADARQWIGTQLAGFERRPTCTPADFAAHELIAQLRQVATEQAFQNYDFGDSVVEAVNGWEGVSSVSPAGEYSRKVFIQSVDGEGSEPVSFTVRFDGMSVVPAEVSALLVSSGQEIGFDESPGIS